jgi:SAM-dependent methyltransferase
MVSFDEYAQSYESLLNGVLGPSGEDADYFAGYKARWFARRVGPAFQGRVLDYGCGIGLMSRHLAACLPAARVEAFDVSEESIRLAAGRPGPAVHYVSRAEDLHPPFDAILLANVLHHVPPAARRELVVHLKRLLAIRGVLVFFEHNPLNPLTRRVVRELPYDRDAALLCRVESAALLRENGLRVVRRDYIVFFPRFLGCLRRFEPWLRRCPLGAQHVVAGEKDE